MINYVVIISVMIVGVGFLSGCGTTETTIETQEAQKETSEVVETKSTDSMLNNNSCYKDCDGANEVTMGMTVDACKTTCDKKEKMVKQGCDKSCIAEAEQEMCVKICEGWKERYDF